MAGPSSGAAGSADPPRQRSLMAKGAKVGKLLPGEKAHLRREAIKVG